MQRAAANPSSLAPADNVPILELRSLPTMDTTTFVDFAVKLARLVAFLNQAQDKTFGEV